MEQTSVSEAFVFMLAPYVLFKLSPPWLNLRYSYVLTLCEPFSLFHQIIDSLFLCGNVLHKLEILYSSLTRLCFKRNPAESRAKIWRHYTFKQPVASAAVHSLAVIMSLLNAHNFVTRWYSLIKFLHTYTFQHCPNTGMRKSFVWRTRLCRASVRRVMVI